MAYVWRERTLDMRDIDLAKIAKFVLEDAHIKPGETVIQAADTAASERFLKMFMAVANAMDINISQIIWPYNPAATLATPPPKTVVAALIAADVCINSSVHEFIYSPAWPKILETSRVLWVKAVEDYLLRVAGPPVDRKDPVKKAKIIQEKFSKCNKMRMTSPQGTNLTVDGIRRGSDYTYIGEVFKKGQESLWPGGNAYVIFEKESVNGDIVFDGAMAQPMGVLRDPVKISVKNDKITKIEGGVQAKLFERYIEELNDPNLPYVVHIGLGMNPGAIATWDMAEAERVKGAILLGIGRQQFWFEREEHLYPMDKGMTAKAHIDALVLEGTLWLDDELLIKDGVYVAPELM